MKNRSLFLWRPVALLVPAVAVLLVGLLGPLLASPAGALSPLPTTSTSAATSATPTTSGPVARAQDPRRDYPRMPAECVPSREKIPAKPTVCALTDFDKSLPTVLLWGDSHAWMFIPALRRAAEGRQVNLVAVMMGSCPPMDNAVKPNAKVPPCYRSNSLGIRTAKRLAMLDKPFRVVLSGSWERYVHALKTGEHSTYIGRMAKAMREGTPRLAQTLRSIGAQVDVIGQVATVPTKRSTCAAGEEPYRCRVSRATALPEQTSTRNWVAKNLRPVLGSRPTIDVTPYICDSRVCNGTVGSTLTWFDDLHLSASMAAEMAPYLQPSVDAVAPAPEPEPEPEPEPTCTIPILCP